MKAPSRILIASLFAVVLFSTFIFSADSFRSENGDASASQSAQQQQAATTSPEGAELYKQKCAVCHDEPQDRVPPLFLIRRRSAEDVVMTLTSGSMKQQAAGLSAEQVRALAIHLTGKQLGPPIDMNLGANRCAAPPKPIQLKGLKGSQWNGWGFDLDNSRFQPNPGIKAEDVPKLKVKWAWAHPGPMATGQPTVIGDRLYLTVEAGMIVCLNAQTGCAYWAMQPGAAVRAAVSVGPLPAGSKAKYAVYFGDEKSNIQALDADTGKLIWKTKVEDHFLSRITGAPVLYRNRLYVPVSSFEETAGRDAKYECCTFRGSLLALDAYTGKILWKSFTVQQEPKPFKKNSAGTQMHGPAGGAIWSAPTLDLKRKLIYAGTGNSYTDIESERTDAIVAFEMETGKIKWVNQATPKDSFLVGCGRAGGAGNCPEKNGPDYDFGSSPVLRTLPNGKQILLGGQKSGVMWAFDPDDNGKVLWQVKVGNGGALGGIEWGFAADAENVYIPVADPGGSARKPGLTALKIATGEQLWQVPSPPAKCSWGATRCNNSQSAAATVIPGVVFSGTADGRLRAYSTKDGAIIWEVDTAQPVNTVNAGEAKGGTLDGGGPTVANGILYTNSGYGRLIGYPGNLLLAFTVDGK
jgi:polyvinyl alcohol dehydrogenase (cytochrome)